MKAYPKKRLQDLISPLVSDQKLTHAYISWGSLLKKTAAHEFSTHNEDFIFDLASLTKVLVTLPLIQTVLKEAQIPLESPLSHLMDGRPFPSAIAQISFLSILEHRSPLPSWYNFWMNRLGPDFRVDKIDRTERLKCLLERVPFLLADIKQNPLSEISRYSDVGFLILGVLLECFYKKDLAEIFKMFCKQELKLKTMPIFFPKSGEGRFVPTAFCKIRNRNLMGEVHDENAAALGGHCGHAGVFGSGRGVVEYLKQWFETPMGQQLIGINSSRYQMVNKGEYLVGWQKEDFSFAKDVIVFKHLGFTGTGIWILPRQNAFIIILTNRIISSRTSSWIQSLRYEICKALWEDLSLELIENA
jgi:CubicO group peptidase (beta-lactamase class C family)